MITKTKGGSVGFTLFSTMEGAPLTMKAWWGVKEYGGDEFTILSDPENCSFPEHAMDKESLSLLADKAMYKGKASTRNVVNIATI